MTITYIFAPPPVPPRLTLRMIPEGRCAECRLPVPLHSAGCTVAETLAKLEE